MFLFLFAILGILHASPEAKPFWKAKEKVYARVQNGEVIVAAKSVPHKGAMKNHMRVDGGGIVKAPGSFVFKQAQQFDQLAKVSGYIESPKFDPATGQLEFDIAALGYRTHMKLQLKILSQPDRIKFLVLNGGMQGLEGQFSFAELSPLKTEVGIGADFHYNEAPVPKVFLGFGLEVVFQRMAMRLREHVEDQYRKEVSQ